MPLSASPAMDVAPSKTAFIITVTNAQKMNIITAVIAMTDSVIVIPIFTPRYIVYAWTLTSRDPSRSHYQGV